MFQFKNLFFIVVSFYKSKSLIFGPDSHRVHISFRAKHYKMQHSSWDSINAAEESMIDVHIERSQNSTIYYASIFRIKIAFCRFLITEHSFLKTLNFDKISHEHKNECLSQIELFESRKWAPVGRSSAQKEKKSDYMKLRLVD